MKKVSASDVTDILMLCVGFRRYTSERERDSRDQGYRNGEVLVEVRPARPVF